LEVGSWELTVPNPMIDSHCHLAGEEFEADLPEVVARAQAEGVDGALCILAAGNEAEAAGAARVRSAWPGVWFSTGIHPHQAGEWAGRIPDAVSLVRRAISDVGACAIGEIGLDYHYDFSPRDVQQAIFTAQIQLARELDLPVVIHTREATADTFALLRDAGGGLRGVFHCFTGDAAMADEAVEMGFHVSFAGIVTFPRAAELREAARVVPADRLLAETDAPYLAPVPWRGRRNEPAFVRRVYETLADVRGAAAEDVQAQVRANFQALFVGAGAHGAVAADGK
jgi:TatD DNase family protein